jgi:hypothetical protein
MAAGGPVGDLKDQSLEQIWEGDVIRTLRTSILQGNLEGLCSGCSLAQARQPSEFAADLIEFQGGPRVQYDSAVQRVAWPRLYGGDQIITENARLDIAANESTKVTEDRNNGLHRVLIDVEPQRGPVTISLVVRPSGRRRFRIDVADIKKDMVGRVLLVLTNNPVSKTQIGPASCVISRLPGSTYSITLSIPAETTISHINFTLMREDNALLYPGDGRSGIEIGGLRIVGADERGEVSATPVAATA